MSMRDATPDPGMWERLQSGVAMLGESQARLPVRAPFTCEVLTGIPSASEADVEWAVGRARMAQPEWSARRPAARARIFLRFHELLLERQNQVLDLIQWETGKARRHALEEILDTAVVARHYARAAASLLKPRRRRGAIPLFTRAWELRHPIGVVGFIVPWNYPLNLAVTDAIAALMAGNTGVLRPDPQSSLTALWAVALLREAGLPRDVL